MNRKLTVAMLLFFASVLSIGVFTSCKDDAEDNYTYLKLQNSELKKALEDAVSRLEGMINSCMTNCQGKWEDFNKTLEDNGYASFDDMLKDLTNIVAYEQTIKDLQSQVTNIKEVMLPALQALLEGKIDDLRDEYKDALANLEETILADLSDLEARVEALESLTETLEGAMTDKDGNLVNIQDVLDQIADVNDQLTKVNNLAQDALTAAKGAQATADQAKTDAALAYAQALMNKAQIDALWDALNKIKECNCKDWTADIAALQDSLKTLSDQYAALNSALEAASKKHDDDLAKLLGMLGISEEDWANATVYNLPELFAEVQEHHDQIEALQGETAEIFTYLNKLLDELITSVIVQSCYNNVFGTFALPFGINSNVLMAYFGENATQNYEFPTNNTDAEYVMPTENPEEGIIGEGWDVLRPEQIDVPEGYIINDLNGNMGTLYFTLNPSNVNFANQDVELSLVNSQGTAANLEFGKFTVSDQVITFGNTYGRAESQKTYLYEVPVNLTEDGISSLRFTVDGQKLKDAFKDVLHNRGISDIAHLGKALYDQFNNRLEAYALQTYNTVSGSENISAKDRTVTSQLNIAATCFKPLSFRFLAGQGTSRDILPHISPLTEYLDQILRNINVNIKAPEFKFDDFTFTIERISDLRIDFNGSVQVCIPRMNVYDKDGNLIGTTKEEVWVTVDDEDIHDMLDSVQDALQKALDEVNVNLDKISDDLKDFINDIKESIDKSMNDFVNNISSQLNDIKGKIRDELAGHLDRLDNFVDRYNSFAARINNLFHNPNHYLQVTAIFEGNDGGFHQLSTSLKYPSKFRKGSGDAISMFLTTYTAELVAPAYKKYVAVTNVFNADDKEQAADWKTQLGKVNVDDLNKVLYGRQKRFAFPTDNLKAGYIYEITYQAIDYHGVTSTRKMYLEIVD